MKKVLLGTSALAGIAIAGPAFAQATPGGEPIKLGLFGHFLGAYGAVLGDSGASKTHLRTDDIFFDNIIGFSGSTKLDNGLTVGVVWQVRAQNIPDSSGAGGGFFSGEDRIKRQWASFSGSFGDFRIGDFDDARRQKGVTAPVPGGGNLFGANTPQFGGPMRIPGGLTNSTVRSITRTSRISQLEYLTPTIAGFSAAVTYAPGGEKGGAEFCCATNPVADSGVGTINNFYSIAGAYSGKFGPVSLNGAAGYSHGHRVTTSAATTGHFNPEAWDVGVTAGFGPVTVGGAYEYARDTAVVSTGVPHREDNTWDLGAIYEMGPFGIGIDWTRGFKKAINGNSATGILDVVSLSTDYKLGPGIQAGVAIDWNHWRSNTTEAGSASPGSETNNYNGLAIIAATGIFF